MCTVSMVGDHYAGKPEWQRMIQPTTTTYPQQAFDGLGTRVVVPVDKREFDALKKEVLEMRELLKRAAEYDKRNNEPHCEQEDKIRLLKQVAEAFGVDLSEVFK